MYVRLIYFAGVSSWGAVVSVGSSVFSLPLFCSALAPLLSLVSVFFDSGSTSGLVSSVKDATTEKSVASPSLDSSRLITLVWNPADAACLATEKYIYICQLFWSYSMNILRHPLQA